MGRGPPAWRNWQRTRLVIGRLGVRFPSPALKRSLPGRRSIDLRLLPVRSSSKRPRYVSGRQPVSQFDSAPYAPGMHLDTNTLRSFRPHLEAAGTFAPRPALTALIALTDVTDGDEVLAAVAARKEDGDLTRWRVAWLTEAIVAYVEASRGSPSWALEAEDQNYDNLSAWARPTRSIEAVQVDNVTSDGDDHDTEWHWTVSGSLLFRDGRVLSLPLFDGVSGHHDSDQTDHFRAAVVAQWRAV